MPENKFRQFFFAACFCLTGLASQALAQSVIVRPDRLREGDGKTRSVTLEANVASGGQLSVSVSYSSDPGGATTSFIPKFLVRDNDSQDRNSQDGKIRLVLPKPFDRTGVYVVEVEETRSILRVVHEPNNSSYFRQFVDWLVGAAGSGQRDGERKTALQRIEELTKNGEQNKLAIWTTPLPAAGQEIDEQSRTLRIKSAVMPAWSNKGNIAASAWRNGKWLIAAYTISAAGEAQELWQWNPRKDKTSDFSPAWSPGADAVAFVRLNPDQKSDIWILRLDKNSRPTKETKVTDFGNVQAVLGWDKDLGVLFETKKEIEGRSSLRQMWATKPALEGTAATVQHTPLADAYNLLRGAASRRGTLIYAQENDGPPISVVYEMDSSGKRRALLMGEFCSYKWPTVSNDEKLLAFDFDCPR